MIDLLKDGFKLVGIECALIQKGRDVVFLLDGLCNWDKAYAEDNKLLYERDICCEAATN